MDLTRKFSYLVWKLLVYSAVGFAALIALSVVVPLFSVLLVFTVLGFLLWLPAHAMLSAGTGRAGDYWKHAMRTCRGTIILPLAACKRIRHWLHGAKIECQRTTEGASAVLLEAASGAMLGCLLLFLRRPSFEPDGMPLWLGAVAGGVVGLAVGLANRTKPAVHENSDSYHFEESLCARNS